MKRFLFLLPLLLTGALQAAPAPDFAVTTSDNQVFKLYQNYINQGKVVVIEAFFTTCPPCNTHAPLVQSLYNQMTVAHPGKVEFILLSTLSTDSNVKVAQYKTSKGLTMPAAGADGGSLTALQPYTSNQFGLFQGTPTFIVIAPNTGEVFFDIRGGSASQTMTLLSNKIEALLPAPPCALQDFSGNALPEVNLRIETSAFDTVILANGSYSLKQIPQLANSNYWIYPSVDDNPLNGLTTYDLVLISKHILGIEELACDWQLLGADVNCSGTITTSDIVTARKLILGILQDLPCGSWRFVPDSATAVSGNCAQFTATKIGDVNGVPCPGFSPGSDDRSSLALTAVVAPVPGSATTRIDIYSPEAMPVEGLQLALQTDPANLKIESISSAQLPGFDGSCYNLSIQERGIVPLIWVQGVSWKIDPDVPLLTILVRSTGSLPVNTALLDIQHSTNGLQPELYQSNGIRDLELRWQPASGFEAPRLIYPNPNRGRFTVEGLPAATAHRHIQVTDVQGRLIYETVSDSNDSTRLEIGTGIRQPGLYALRIDGLPAGKFLID